MAKNYKNNEIMEVYWKVNLISYLILYLYWPVYSYKRNRNLRNLLQASMIIKL